MPDVIAIVLTASNTLCLEYNPLTICQRMLVPIAAFDGKHVSIDGASVPIASYDRLLAIDALAGTHAVTITERIW